MKGTCLSQRRRNGAERTAGKNSLNVKKKKATEYRSNVSANDILGKKGMDDLDRRSETSIKRKRALKGGCPEQP